MVDDEVGWESLRFKCRSESLSTRYRHPEAISEKFITYLDVVDFVVVRVALGDRIWRCRSEGIVIGDV